MKRFALAGSVFLLFLFLVLSFFGEVLLLLMVFVLGHLGVRELFSEIFEAQCKSRSFLGLMQRCLKKVVF